MAGEGKMADAKQANDSTDHRDDDDACGDTGLVPIQPDRNISQSAPLSAFHHFSKLPWELRRLVWEFALPRSVFESVTLWPEDCVPYPSMSRACREASLVVKEFGSMVTAYDGNKVQQCWAVFARAETEDIPNEADMYIRTWFSSKLDTLILDPNGADDFVPYWWRENLKCGFIDIRQSPTTCLVVHNDLSNCDESFLKNMYQNYLKDRDTILVSIGHFPLVLTDKAWDIAADLHMSESAGNSTKVIRLDDIATLAKCLKLWEQCCHFETSRSFINRHYDFGKWLYMAIDKDKRAGARRWVRAYRAWVGEDQVYEKRLVSHEAYFLLRILDSVVSGHESIKETGRGYTRRGHEVMDDMGRLKKDHHLVQELDIKLPKVIPVCTVSIDSRCRCEEGTARPGEVLEQACG